MLALLILSPLAARVVQQEGTAAGTRVSIGWAPAQVRPAQRMPRARDPVAAVAPALSRTLELQRAPPPAPPGDGGRGGGGGDGDDWSSHRLRKLEADQAQAVLADWGQRARIYRMGTERSELREAHSAALREMEAVAEFSRLAASFPATGMSTLRGLRMVLGLFDPQEAVTGLAAAEVSTIRGVVITGFLVNPAELNDGSSSNYLRLKAGLQLFAQANNLDLDMKPVLESIAIVRGTNDQVIVGSTEYGSTFSAPPEFEAKQLEAKLQEEEREEEEAAAVPGEAAAVPGAVALDPEASRSFRDLDALTLAGLAERELGIVPGWTRGTSLPGDLLAAVAQEDYASAARVRDLMWLLDTLDVSGELEKAAGDLDAAIREEDADTAAAIREQLDLAAETLRAALEPEGGL